MRHLHCHGRAATVTSSVAYVYINTVAPAFIRASEPPMAFRADVPLSLSERTMIQRGDTGQQLVSGLQSLWCICLVCVCVGGFFDVNIILHNAATFLRNGTGRALFGWITYRGILGGVPRFLFLGICGVGVVCFLEGRLVGMANGGVERAHGS